jgi:[ribosomal protein S18]-alanine N-acetyltransferase
MSTELTLRHMAVEDIPEVLVIDAASFTPPWPDRSYRFEINESNVSYMLVLEQPAQRPVRGLRRLWKNLLGDNGATEEATMVVGYGGLWKIADEAHVSTIATHPEYRGRKFGEIMLAGMIQRAITLQAGYIVLEVRVSNTVAQNLYYKYGFELQATKKNYYHHDREDAYEMHLYLTEAAIEQFKQQYTDLQKQYPFRDHYSRIPHPRLGR